MTLPGIPLRILTAAGLMTLALIGLVVREASARAGGQEVWLEIDGYDPRSILSGHYVRFQLRSEAQSGTPCPLLADNTPWVALKRSGRGHLLSGTANTREVALRLGDVAVLGSGECNMQQRREADGPGPPVAVSTLDLGVDRLHADQTQAEAIEKALRAQSGSPRADYAILSIGKDGKARLKALVVAGQRADLRLF